jgi:hypothetical protein
MQDDKLHECKFSEVYKMTQTTNETVSIKTDHNKKFVTYRLQPCAEPIRLLVIPLPRAPSAFFVRWGEDEVLSTTLSKLMFIKINGMQDIPIYEYDIPCFRRYLDMFAAECEVAYFSMLGILLPNVLHNIVAHYAQGDVLTWFTWFVDFLKMDAVTSQMLFTGDFFQKDSRMSINKFLMERFNNIPITKKRKL